MDKDIDELLDEVETKFVKSLPPARTTPPTPTTNVTNRNVEKRVVENNESKKKRTTLDSLINDILDIDVDKSEESASGLRNNSRSSVTDDRKKSEKLQRCFPVLLGGSADETGFGTSINKRACDQLRCTSCDFKVCYFDNRSWNKDIDYLFLRNNVPELGKLESKLSRKTGCRAYCCQCSWRNVWELSELSDPSLKWVCGKHAL